MKTARDLRGEQLFGAWLERHAHRYAAAAFRSFREFAEAADRGEIEGLEPLQPSTPTNTPGTVPC
jgi:hypothetical protein